MDRATDESPELGTLFPFTLPRGPRFSMRVQVLGQREMQVDGSVDGWYDGWEVKRRTRLCKPSAAGSASRLGCPAAERGQTSSSVEADGRSSNQRMQERPPQIASSCHSASSSDLHGLIFSIFLHFVGGCEMRPFHPTLLPQPGLVTSYGPCP